MWKKIITSLKRIYLPDPKCYRCKHKFGGALDCGGWKSRGWHCKLVLDSTKVAGVKVYRSICGSSGINTRPKWCPLMEGRKCKD